MIIKSIISFIFRVLNNFFSKPENKKMLRDLLLKAINDIVDEFFKYKKQSTN